MDLNVHQHEQKADDDGGKTPMHDGDQQKTRYPPFVMSISHSKRH